MGKIIQIEVPDEINEEKLKIAISQAISGEKMTVEEVRRLLGITSEELTEELEEVNVAELREKEKKRLIG
ncbi:hypothetical protein [Archaeoglobus neptunius]|uniref:hypothetical protein n=1 Tax=Archaeoglobus neptunius TaxID=2798580 RepID=UPI001925607D|nr:hypothetical protein [Archaeoglobus neptunius]